MEEERDERANWFGHPVTQLKLKEAEKTREGQVRTLINKAMASNDPEVRGIAARIFASEVWIKNLGGGVKFFEEKEASK